MHKKFLLAALAQAQMGRGICAPNPSVGAVAVQNGTIIAQSYHRGAGTAHAEQLLLEQIPNQINISLYVTLEPCNHWGRTPPCVDAIRAHGGISEVIYAYADPNPIVAKNNSTQRLQADGIRVLHHPLPEIDAFYVSYAYWTQFKKPWVTVKMAQSLDGKIGYTNRRVHLSNSLCEKFTHEHRAQADVLLTTARTVNSDNPQMNVRLDNGITSKPIAILDTRLTLKPDARIFTTARQCHIYHAHGHMINYPNSTFHQVNQLDGYLDLVKILHHLGQTGYHDVWIEAGGSLFSALHKAKLVHRTYLYIVPQILGEGAISAYQQEDLFTGAHRISWQAMEDNIIACIDWNHRNCSALHEVAR